MIKITEFAGQKVGVFGLGKAGEAAAASLKSGGAKVFKWDDALAPLPSPPLHFTIAVSVNQTDNWDSAPFRLADR